jgi:alkanesulfonate monooxygenase SsuD/methylene tetrahydromethanopterin reductase-like flavin-dependent oxidoreductase (luciferase family)
MTQLTKQADFGWMLPTGAQRMPSETSAYLSHLQDFLDRIKDSFHSVWISDHLMDGQADIPEALVTLSYLAGQYPEMFLGTIVICQSFRNPALLAKMATTLQLISDGRFILGLGAGWKEAEYRAYGYNFPKASIRIAQLSEAIQICKQLWDPAQPSTTFKGRYYQIEDARCYPKTVPPPVMVGGGGEQLTLRVVARHADWWNLPGASLEVTARKIKILEGYCQEYGRPADQIRKTWMGNVAIAPTRQAAAASLAGFESWPGDAPLVGTPDEIQDQIAAYIDVGVDLLILRFVDEPDASGIELFRDKVLGG